MTDAVASYSADAEGPSLLAGLGLDDSPAVAEDVNLPAPGVRFTTAAIIDVLQVAVTLDDVDHGSTKRDRVEVLDLPQPMKRPSAEPQHRSPHAGSVPRLS